MHQPAILADIVVLFGTAVIAAWAFRLLRAPSIIGFLFTGILIGPSGLALIRPDDVMQLAEIGLVLLLFTIGLELSPKPLMRMGTSLLTAAVLQIAGITLVSGLVVYFFSDLSVRAAVIMGVVVALSSTAIVLKQLSDRGETNTVAGMITTGILLLQDVVVIVIMLILPLFAVGSGGEHGEGVHVASPVTVLIGLAGLALLATFGRVILPYILARLVRTGGREMTAMFAVLMACGGAWLAGLVGWSLALGACVAGLLLAEADERHQLVADITPFRDVFNALFFISLGMLFDIDLFAAHAPLLIAAVGVTLVFKTAVTAGAVRIAGWPLRYALQVGLGLSTVSEFGYVLALAADNYGLLPEGLFNLIVVYAVGTMLIGAILVPISGPLSRAVTSRLEKGADVADMPETEEGEHRHHVIVVGYGTNGKNLARMLQATHIPHVVIEMNAKLVAQARETGANVIMGDAARLPILEHAGLAEAHTLAVAINDPEATKRIVSQARSARQDLFIIARTRFVAEIDQFYRLGANQVIPEDFETSIEIAAHVLKEMNIPDNIVEAQIAAVRAGRYGMLRGAPADRAAQEELMAVLSVTATRTHYIQPESRAVGKTIAELNLRATTGVTIIAVVRGGTPTTNPAPDFVLQASDVLVLLGAHAQLEAARQSL